LETVTQQWKGCSGLNFYCPDTIVLGHKCLDKCTINEGRRKNGGVIFIIERRSISDQAQFVIVVFHKVMCSHSLGVVIYLNVIGRMTEEISVKNHRDWNSFIECIEK